MPGNSRWPFAELSTAACSHREPGKPPIQAAPSASRGVSRPRYFALCITMFSPARRMPSSESSTSSLSLAGGRAP